MKVLTDITPYTHYVEQLSDFFAEEMLEDEEEVEIPREGYTAGEFLREVYMSRVHYEELTHLLRRKKNVILQGAPGVGKTYAARRLAYSMMGVKDPERVMMVQFHQSYGYEDFIMGFRPTETGGFELRKGPFYTFCKRAEIDSDNDYFFIIDEINRGNLSRVFGELFMLIESDKRGTAIQLLYGHEKFSVPPNVYIIGMMNTADRSLAMLDYAMRRRFAFFEMAPAFDSEGFQRYQKEKHSEKLDRLLAIVRQLNAVIVRDEALGRGFAIGHSFFDTKDDVDDRWLASVVEHDLLPLLEAYWVDPPDHVDEWANRLREAIR